MEREHFSVQLLPPPLPQVISKELEPEMRAIYQIFEIRLEIIARPVHQVDNKVFACSAPHVLSPAVVVAACIFAGRPATLIGSALARTIRTL